MPERARKPRQLQLLLGASSLSIVVAYALVFERYIPNASGHLGHDYSYFLLQLLDGYFWSHGNGYFSVPWNTPGFCGGVPKFSNPQALYFSVPQLLTQFVDPLSSVRLTFVLFGGLGYLGFFLLLRRVFSASPPAAILGATLFLFNGLFASRMLIGHLTFHSFMLVPFLSLALDERPSAANAPQRSFEARCLDVALAALIFAYMAMTALAHVLFQAIAIVITLALLSGLVREDLYPWRIFAVKLAIAGGTAIGITAAKLVAVAHLLEQFPRTLYVLPGIESPAKLVSILILSLFSTPPLDWVHETVVNARWGVGYHEFEFGVTSVPFFLIFVTVFLARSQWATSAKWKTMSGEKRACLAALVLLLLAPLALNFYQVGWNAFLKEIPILANSSSLFRWFSVYIPIVCLVASLCLDHGPLLSRHRTAVAIVGVLIVIALNLTRDRSYYERQRFDPNPVIGAYARVRSGAWSPRVDRIAVARDAAGGEALLRYRNASLARGESQLLCYETLFGFRLENFPRGPLREGDVMQEVDGVLNLKNPACHAYPEVNGCAPGDHFTSAQTTEAAALAAYRPYDFEWPAIQRAGNTTSLLASSGVLLTLLVCGSRRLGNLVRRGS